MKKLLILAVVVSALAVGCYGGIDTARQQRRCTAHPCRCGCASKAKPRGFHCYCPSCNKGCGLE